MTHSSGHDRQAAHWALALRDPDADPDEIQKGLAWLNGPQQNQIAFERVQRFLDACDNIADDAGLQVAEDRVKPFGRVWRRPLALAASLVLLVATTLGIGIIGLNQRDAATPRPAHFASMAGELKTIVLSDNSTILLSGASTVSVMFGEKERRINLARGEALFDVAPDPDRPFVIQAGRGTATALGTEFDVRREGDGATVTVVHGRVAVNSAGSHSHSKAILGPVMQVTYDGRGTMSAVERVDIDTVLAWRTGVLIFSGQPLSRVIREVNRYSPEQILIADPVIGRSPVTGMVKIDRIPEWLQGLEKVMGLSVERNEKGLQLERKSGSETHPTA